jgi:hypothetical protein
MATHGRAWHMCCCRACGAPRVPLLGLSLSILRVLGRDGCKRGSRARGAPRVPLLLSTTRPCIARMHPMRPAKQPLKQPLSDGICGVVNQRTNVLFCQGRKKSLLCGIEISSWANSVYRPSLLYWEREQAEYPSSRHDPLFVKIVVPSHLTGRKKAFTAPPSPWRATRRPRMGSR